MRATCKQSLQVARREVTATVEPVAPQKRGTLSDEDRARIVAACIIAAGAMVLRLG